jgi:bacterioferritin-associated ferredoxin
MVVCICNAIREKDVRAAARMGANNACEAYAKFGRRPKCAQCFRYAETILEEERALA